MKKFVTLLTIILTFSGFSQVIGTQEWMKENLNVSTYRDGTPIPQVTDTKEWDSLKTGAWCYYENNSANGTSYGKLYNWYAINDPRGLAPDGWHVPSDEEWKTLINYLGGENIAAGKMKSTSGWDIRYKSGYKAGNNSSNFTALPGGRRHGNGTFLDNGVTSHWWSSTEFSSIAAWNRFFVYNTDYVNREYISKQSGFSVRCIKD